jgi:hypothetical protein
MQVRVPRTAVLRAGVVAMTLLSPVTSRGGGQAPPASSDKGVPPLALEVQEAPLERARDGIKWESLSVSPDGRRVAYAIGKGAGLAGLVLQPLFMGKAGSFRMVVDGRESPEYVGVSLPRFSPDGSRVAYAAQSGTKMLDALGRPLGRQ